MGRLVMDGREGMVMTPGVPAAAAARIAGNRIRRLPPLIQRASGQLISE
jgi:hypothetical protein